ncbi:MAG TPA: hypothetical protein VF591_15150 [Pyrinomonadaceae bacterium]
MRNRIMLAAMLLGSLLCVGFAFARQEPPRQQERWEYKAACGRPDLNKLGEEGWELSAATQDGNTTCLYFKRRK